MSSWFGGERNDSHRRSSSHKHHRSSTAGTTVVRQNSSSSHHPKRRDSSPKYAWVRPKEGSPTRSSYSTRTRSPDRHYQTRERDRGGYGDNDATRSFTSLFSTLTGGAGERDRYATRGGSSSYYKRRPRDGYISRLLQTLRRYLRRLMDYARRNPIKVILLVVMPLVTGGALNGLLRGMGVSVPSVLSRFGDGGRRGGGLPGGGGGGGSEGFGIEQAVNIAKMFV